LAELLRQSAVSCLIRFLIWFVFIGAMAAMPDELNTKAAVIFTAVVVLRVIWARGGMLWLGRKLHLFSPAPERLQKICNETAARMDVPFREVLLMRISLAQAYAFLDSRRLAFTTRLVDICPDDELAAICAHELGHLTESKTARLARYVNVLTFMPWLFFKPLVHTYGLPALAGLLALTLGTPYLSRKISRKLESRADQIAKSNEAEPGTYARALARLYEDGLIPAVIVKNRQTHPDLYDRLLAAGITPDYPRPAPAKTMAWHGSLLAGGFGALFAVFVMRMILQLF
jgi:Zn-dependent protease with chaperone function